MIKVKNTQLMYAGVGILLAVFVSVLFVSGVFAEARDGFKRGAYSSETKSAIYESFENADYDAYVAVAEGAGNRGVLTKEEFDRHVEKIAEKKQIRDAVSRGDYATYRALTDGSSRQLSEAAFAKKSQMLALKDEVKEAIENRDYEAFLEKRQALKDFGGDRYMGRKHSASGTITEEEFNALADRHEQYGAFDGHMRGGHKFGKGRNHHKN